MEDASSALEGLKVLDLSRILAGPYCAQMLGDHGAEVIKVEPPAGDDSRLWGPPFTRPGESSYFTGLNRNKRNIVLDLAAVDGQQHLRNLLAQSDVVVENFKTGTLSKWGFDDDSLREAYPRLIHARITGFGTTGPLASVSGYDAILQAYGGLMSLNGETGGDPLRVGVPIVDIVTGLHAFAGILLAVIERQTSGRGQLVDCTLLDTAVSLLHPHSATWLGDGRVPLRTGSAHPTISPYDCFATSDGAVFVAVGNDRQFGDLVRVLGLDGTASDPRFLSNADRTVNRQALRNILAPAIALTTRAVLLRQLSALQVPATAINDISEALTSPQVIHRNMVETLGSYRGVGIPIKLDRTPGRVRTAPRRLGEDNDEILRY